MASLVDLIKNNPAHAAVIEGELRVKNAVMATPVVDFNQRLVKGLVSTPDVDQDDEVVQCANLETDYFPISVKAVYVDHDYTKAVGTCRALSVRGDCLYAVTHVPPTSLGDDILTMVENEVIRHFSIGARATDYGPPTADEIAKYGPHRCNIRKGRLIEYSFTSMPANQNAMIELVTKSAIKRANAVVFGFPDTPERKFFPTTGPAKIERPAVVFIDD